MKMIKILSLVLALAMVLGLFAACGNDKPADTTAGKNNDKPADTTAAPVDDETEWAWGTVHGVTWTLGGLVDQSDATKVQREQESLDLAMAETGNSWDRMEFSYNYTSIGAQFESGALPTYFDIAATEPVKLIKNGWGRTINECVERVGINLDNFNQTILSTYYDEDGGLWGLPYTAYSLCILVNASLFREAGLVDANGEPTMPTTWDEVIEYGNIINEKTGKGGMMLTCCDNQGGWNFTNVAWNYGADLAGMNDDGTFWVNVNSAEAVAAVEMYAELAASAGFYGDPLTSTRDTCVSNLKAGNCAMIFGAGDMPRAMSSIANDGMNPEDLYAINIPAGPGGQVNLTGGSGVWFSPNATDDQVVAILERMMHVNGRWVEEASADAVDGWETTFIDQLADNQVNLPDFPVYVSAAYNQKNEMMLDYQTNFNYDLQYKSYYDFANTPGNLRAEEEGDTQNLYRELTAALQQVITDPTCDIQAVMDGCQANCQDLYNTFNNSLS